LRASGRNPVVLSAALAVALVGWGLLILAFAALMRRGWTVSIVMGVLGLAVLEAALYSSGNFVPRGIFNPSAGGLSISIFEIVIAAALVAGLISGRRPTMTPAMVWWVGFLAWIGVATIVGLAVGNPAKLVLFSSRIMIYVAFLLLASTVPARQYIGPRGLPVVLLPSAVVASLLIAMTSAGATVDLPIPTSPVSGFGEIGADAATIFSALGVIALAWALVSPRARIKILIVSVPLLATPLFAFQRAALIGAGISLVILAVAFALRAGRSRIQLGRKEVLAVGLGAVAVLLAGVLATTAMRGAPPENPIAQNVDATFNAQGKASAAATRLEQWDAARGLIAERPWFGHGLGAQFEFYAPGQFEVQRSRLSHNIWLDLGVRTGAVGIALFALALILTLGEGIATWARASNALIAATALALVAAVVSLIAKGMFESIFEKYRLMAFLGVVLGVLFSAVLATARERAVRLGLAPSGTRARGIGRRPRAPVPLPGVSATRQ
jgi:O-antigen ligase